MRHCRLTGLDIRHGHFNDRIRATVSNRFQTVPIARLIGVCRKRPRFSASTGHQFEHPAEIQTVSIEATAVVDVRDGDNTSTKTEFFEEQLAFLAENFDQPAANGAEPDQGQFL